MKELFFIRGNNTRSSEVIRALERLGAVNKNYKGDSENYWYFIDDGKISSLDLTKVGLYEDKLKLFHLLRDHGTELKLPELPEFPRSWEEFCKITPVTSSVHFIYSNSNIANYLKSSGKTNRNPCEDRNLCTSKEEAEAFLALMQLRQLREAWIKDLDPNLNCGYIYYIYNDVKNNTISYCCSENVHGTRVMSFPTIELVEDFLSCFKDLLERAKILL